MEHFVEHWYRCDSVVFEGGRVCVSIHSYPVEKRTPCGCWLNVYSFRRWVRASGKKRFAHPTKAEAIQAFQARKRRQISILLAQLDHAQQCLEMDPKDFLDCSVSLCDDCERPVSGPVHICRD